MTKTSNDLHQRFTGLIAMLNDAQDKVHEGIIINLKHLDDDARALCADVAKLPPASAKALKPVMAEMISALEALERDLANFRDKNRSDGNQGGA